MRALIRSRTRSRIRHTGGSSDEDDTRRVLNPRFAAAVALVVACAFRDNVRAVTFLTVVASMRDLFRNKRRIATKKAAAAS